MRADLVANVGAELGEGPVLFPDGSMWWVDLLTGQVYRWHDGHNARVTQFDHEVATVLPAQVGTIALSRTGPLLLTETGQIRTEFARYSPESNLRCSDGVVLPDGSVVFGVVDRDLAPERGHLARLDRDGEITTILERTTVSNGLAVLPDRKRVVWTDSATGRIDVFDLDPVSGALINRRPWCMVPENVGVPDGLCTDADGGVWVAMWGGAAVLRFDEQGRLDAVVDVGVPDVTSCAFSTDDTLIITTAAVRLDAAARAATPGAGGLWALPASAHGARRAPTFTAAFG
jgi:sugar lactone lactonase YvrE